MVFDPDTVGDGPLKRVYDLPGGADRLISEASGIDAVIVNTATLPTDRLPAYHEEGSEPVAVADSVFEQKGIEVVGADLLVDGQLIRHDPLKLAEAILSILQSDGQS